MKQIIFTGLAITGFLVCTAGARQQTATNSSTAKQNNNVKPVHLSPGTPPKTAAKHEVKHVQMAKPPYQHKSSQVPAGAEKTGK